MATDIRVAVDLFSPARLKLARESVALTQSELAGRVGVTSGAVSQFERGYARPTPGTLRELAFALAVPVGFLAAAEPWQPVDLSQAFFRKLASTSRKEQLEACATASLLQLFVGAIDRYVDLPPLQLEHHPVQEDAAASEVANAAAALREEWGLGQQPIEDVVYVLESHGIPVVRVSDIAAKVDGFSCLSYARPIVLLGKHKGDRARSRFDAAHELGHLVMHHEYHGGHKVREAQAQAFASAFLAPMPAIRKHLPAKADTAALLHLKRKWGMSMQAFLHASKETGQMSESTYRYAMIQFGKKNWRTNEPGYLGEPEQPQMLRKALGLLEGVGISFEQLVDEADLPMDRVQAFLHDGETKRPRLNL